MSEENIETRTENVETKKEYNLAARMVRYAASGVDGVLEALPKATQYNWMPYNLAKPPVDLARKYTPLVEPSDLEKKIQDTTKVAVESVAEVGEAVAAGYSLYTMGAGLFGASVGWFAPMYLGLKAVTNTFSWLLKTVTGNNPYVTNLFKAPEPTSS